VAGSSVCVACPSATSYGATVCMWPTSFPSGQPSVAPSKRPTSQPSAQPTNQPVSHPTSQPSGQPSKKPSSQPVAQPTLKPSSQPTRQPSARPSHKPTVQPTSQPTSQPIAHPTCKPTVQPTGQPTSQPIAHPTCKPTDQPTGQPTGQPTRKPSAHPTAQPTGRPTHQPTSRPTAGPTSQPTAQPSARPTSRPTSLPTAQPTRRPTSQPTRSPTACPTTSPSDEPTSEPTSQPTGQPTSQPSSQPTTRPTGQPSGLPTGVPTSDPTNEPSSQPTAHPTETPTGQPSTRPTSQPTAQPTAQPSSQPSSSPSSSPSKCPTSQPTAVPSRKPTAQPSRAPTLQPTSQPSRQPTGRPSSKPSSTPSSRPSGRPSGQPTREPTYVPTSSPSGQPTSLPSKRPSAAPSAQPTAKPSSRPSRAPSSHPSADPTRQPTGRPTTQPSSRPTRQPSSQPSARPSTQPSSRPSKRPSAQPSMHPSGQPTVQPTGQPTSSPVAVRAVKTSRPTPKPTQVPSSLPSSVPSAEPTLSLASRWKDKFDGVRDSQFTGSNMLSFFDVEVNGIDVSSTTSVGNGCARWNSFLSFLATKQIGYYPAYITAIKFDSLDSTVARNVTCRTVAKSSQVTGLLATAFRSSGQAATAVTCSIDGSTVTGTWTVGSCGSRPYLRVASATTTLLQLSPCNSSCDVVSTGEKTGVIRGVGIALTANYPAPDIISVNVTSPSKTVISATVRTSGPGLAYCAAYPTSSFAAPSSPSAVIIAGVSAWTVGNVSRINVTSLRPYTEYTVLCGVSSQQGITTTVDTMVFKAISVWTPCCRTVSVAIKSKNSLLGSVVTNAVVVTVSSLPSSSLGLSFSLTKGTNSYSLLSPSTIAFSSKSAASANLALLTTTVSGDYNVTVTLTGVEQSAYEVVYVGGNKRIRVFDSTQEPTAPSLSSAVFSADGANISMAFDIATNFGQLGGSRFVCSKLFRFVGDDTSTCLWDAAGITVVVKPSYSSSLIVGSNISLRSEVIKAACPASLDCSSWSFSSTSTVFIASPTEPVAPVVVIGAPSVIGLCADLPLDISGSLGSGGRKWQAVNIRVDSPTLSNTTALESYFGRADVQRTLLTSLRLTVPSTHFESSSLFSISIQLCNFLGSCGLQQFVLTVSALSTPVSIMGASVRSQFTSQSLTLKALAYTASCDTGDSSSSQLLYSWSITSLSTSGALAISSVPTVSDTSLYFVRSFALQPLNSYDIVVTITSAQTKLSSSAAVTVSVLQGSLVASIAGGSYRSCRVGESIEVDGSASYDSDQANFGQAGLVFNWTSYQLLPSYSASCPILHSSSSGVTSWTG
jgi:hypothetical protein